MKLKKIVAIVLAFVMVLAFASIASAAQSATKTFTASQCTNYFTTSQYLVKPAGNWYTFYCRATMSWPDGNSSWNTLNATPQTSSGNAAGPVIVVQYSTTTGYGIYANAYLTTTNIYYKIANPHQGYNMPCEGMFWGNT